MKRFASVILLILVLVNIFSVTAFASSGEDSSDSGYSMTLNGVTQSIDWELFEETLTGYSFYNGVRLPTFNIESWHGLCIIVSVSGVYHFYPISSLCTVTWDSNNQRFIVYNGSTSSCGLSDYRFDGDRWNEITFTSLPARVSYYIPANFSSVVWVSSNVLNSKGSVAFSAGSCSPEFGKSVVSSGTSSFSSADLLDFSFSDKALSLMGDFQPTEICGDVSLAVDVSSPYVDVEFPISAWVDEVPEDDDYWSVSVNGDLSFDLGIGLEGSPADLESSYFLLSDLVPTSWQLLCNGSLLSDPRCSGTFDSVGLTSSGYNVALSMDTGKFNLSSVSTGEHNIKPHTLGFRIYLSSLSGGSPSSFNGVGLIDRVRPYVYLNFATVDGVSGLPSLTFHENYVSGDMSTVVNPSGYGSSFDGFSFDFGYYSNSIAASGKCFYGNFELPVVPAVSGKPYLTMFTLGTPTDTSDYYCFVSSSRPVFNTSTNRLVMSSDVGLYYLASANGTWEDRSASAGYISLRSLDNVFFVNYDVKDSSGALLKPYMVSSSSGSSSAHSTVSPGSDFLNLNSNAGHAVLYSSPVTYDSVGSVGSKFSFSNDSMTGYVDVTYPAGVFGIRSKGQLLSLLLSGNLAVRSSIFPLAIDSSTNEYYVPYSFDNPTMVEVIINGEFFSDLYLLNYLHEDSSIASVSGFNMSVADIGKVETITFRFHYSVDPQTTEWLVPEDIPVDFDSFAVGVDCEIITSPVFTAEYEPDRVMTGLGKFFDNLAIPYEISQVFDVFVGIWEVIPAAIRFTLIMCFSVACFFAVAKMLF